MPPEKKKGSPIDDPVRIDHKLEAARDIRTYVSDRSRPDLDTDSMLLRAVTNAVQQIGEAAARVTQDGRARAPDLP